MTNASKKRTVTEEVDFTGCDSDIAEALRNGKTIKCICWDNPGSVERMKIVIAYMPGSEYPYLTADSCYRSARPIFIETVTVVKSEVEIMKMLVEYGYEIHEGYGIWYPHPIGIAAPMHPKNWKRCGKSPDGLEFEDWMLEEREIPESTSQAG